jgi:LysM repeat protein
MVSSVKSRPVKAPPSHKDVARVKVDATQLPEGAAVHQVVKRDTLSEIARKNGVPLEQLKAANPALLTQERQDGHWIYPGDEVVIPVAPPEGWKAPSAKANVQAAARARESGGAPAAALESETIDARSLATLSEAQYAPLVAALVKTDPTLGELVAVMAQAGNGAPATAHDPAVEPMPKLIAKAFEWASANDKLDLLDAALIAQKPDGKDAAAVRVYETARLAISQMRVFETKAKLPPPAAAMTLDLSQKSFTEMALETATPLRGPTDLKLFDDYWKQNTASLNLMDSIAAQLTKKPPPAGNQGVLHGRLAQELSRRFPEADIDFVVLPSYKAGLLTPTEGVVGLSVTDYERVESKVTQTIAADGSVTLSGQVPPGKAFVLDAGGGLRQDVSIDAQGNWNVSGVPPEAAKTLPAVASMVAKKEVKTYSVNTGLVGMATALYSKSPEEQAKWLAKMADVPGGLVGGLLKEQSLTKEQTIGQVGAKQLLAGKTSEIPARVSIEGAKDLKRDFTFAEMNAAVLYQEVFMRAALQGDAPATWESKDFEKNIAHAMHLDVDVKTRKTKSALSSDDKAAIKDILKNVTEAAGGNGANAKVTTLPLVITVTDGSTVELPLFRVEGKNGQPVFIDNEGRKYDSFQKWKDENRLMADFKVSYPKEGKLTLDTKGLPEFTTENTRLTVDTPMEKLEVAFNYGSMVGGVLLGPAGWLLRASMAAKYVLFAGQGLNAAFAVHNAYGLYEMGSHGQTLSPMDGEARGLMLGLGATLLGGAGLQGMITPARSAAGATAYAVAQNASMYAFAGMLGDQGITMAQHWDEIPVADRAMFLAMTAMMGGQTALVGVRQSFSFNAAKQQMNAMMKPPKADPNFLNGVGTRPLTPKEQKWLDAKLEALVSLHEQSKGLPAATLQDLRIVQNKLKSGQPLNAKERALYNQLSASWSPGADPQ